VFDNVSAEVGGGKMLLGGALSYNGPPRYDVTARAEQVRIRYPVGMSWHADGTLRLTGTAQAATLSGRVTVDRLLMSDAVDITSLLGASQKAETFSLQSSAFLRNLELDVQASAAPNAVLEWPSGNFQAEANVRLRGTWENPILLGNIHLLGGYMEFRGDRYQLSRGEINFANPFRLDPVLNIEVTTRIQQYEITVNFSGEASHLTMSYRSEPPLPSSDVVTLLALGQTGEESALRGLNGAQTPQVGATTLLSEAFSSQLGGRIQRLFGISHFSVDPFLAGSTAASQSAAARVTVEQHFSPDLTVTYVTNVGGTQEQVIQIEYAVRRDIAIVALRDDTGTFGIDVIFRKYFK
jgi:translocation and assembly module TamB